MKEALWYEKREGNLVHCFLCSQHCRIRPNERGKCGVRENRDGTLWSLVYGRVIARNVDPIEKKPLYHFHPGSASYSIATMGCNFRCLFCQNADISQAPREYGEILGLEIPPQQIVEQAQETRCASISYTYTEPTVFMEYALDVARLAHRAGIKNVFVTNGYMTEQSLNSISEVLDAANVDLKAFTDEFYEKQCGARLKPVLKTIEGMKKAGVWLEVTTLLIPGLNDGEEELSRLADFLAGLDPDIPWHISRFHPTYRMTDRPVTPVGALHRARRIGLDAGLRHVYPGNVPGDEGENTFCRQCGELLIERFGFSMRVRGLREGKCRKCSTVLPGVGLP
ncbi:MAG: AmmeMemoRadiSam system radical SAM enzyme [Syntrophobacteraceae bacterium]|nr:AmmeMemoRadiSam system radical SAM enzyme [Syntrophobacteraceae bacterium]